MAYYLSRVEHEAPKHSCCGVLIVVSGRAQGRDLEEALDHSLISSQFHLYEGEECIRLAYVRGPSDRIKAMLLRLISLAKRVEFIPLH